MTRTVPGEEWRRAEISLPCNEGRQEVSRARGAVDSPAVCSPYYVIGYLAAAEAGPSGPTRPREDEKVLDATLYNITYTMSSRD